MQLVRLEVHLERLGMVGEKLLFEPKKFEVQWERSQAMYHF